MPLTMVWMPDFRFSWKLFQSNSLSKPAKVSNAPLITPTSAFAMSVKLILLNIPVIALPTAFPSSVQPVMPASFFLDISFTNPDNILQEIMNLFPSSSPRDVQLISLIAPRSPFAILEPILLKSMPPFPISRFNEFTKVLTPAPSVRPIRSQLM